MGNLLKHHFQYMALTLFLLSLFFLLLATLYALWSKTLDKRFQIRYPLLGSKDGADLREIVETQWRKVSVLSA